jgi:hypothetical protein
MKEKHKLTVNDVVTEIIRDSGMEEKAKIALSNFAQRFPVNVLKTDQFNQDVYADAGLIAQPHTTDERYVYYPQLETAYKTLVSQQRFARLSQLLKMILEVISTPKD